MNEYKDKRVLVTGGTGLIGRQVVDLLVEYGAHVRVITLDRLRLNEHVLYLPIDLKNYGMCLKYTRNLDYVFHLAGIKASPDITKRKPATMSIPPLQINSNVLEACKNNHIQNVLFTSSIGAYTEDEILKESNAYNGEPMDFYPGMVKRMAEYQIKAYQEEFGLNYKVVRLANCFGQGDNFNPDNGMFISSLMAKVLRGDNPVEIWGDGTQIRDFTYSKDIARGILQMMMKAKDCEPVNLGSGIGYTVKEVCDLLLEVTDFDIKFNSDRPTGVKKRVLDISKAVSLGYQPQYSLLEALKETWEWFQQNSEEHTGRLNYFANKS